MVEMVVSVAAKVSEYLVEPAVRQLGYLFNYRTNIEDLSERVEKLKVVRDRKQQSVDEAKRNGELIFADVPMWLTRADGFIQDASNLLEDEKAAPKSCLNGLMCPNLKSRYQLSRAARKKAGVADKIHGDGLQIEKVSYLPSPKPIRSATSEALPSRVVALNEVMEALREVNVNKIGVWGLGGVGKSTLVKQVAEQAAQEKQLFDKVVMASVLQTADLKRIQGELADELGMKFEQESEKGRAAQLHRRMKEEKTILVILDDLWAELDLDKIGVPSPTDHHKGCKLLLTSRNRDVLSNQMGTQKEFLLQHLQEDEAWVLFKNRAGDDTIENPELKQIAIEVAKLLAGLPLALVTVATTLKNKSLPIWRDALQQLKRPTPTNIGGMDAKEIIREKCNLRFLKLEKCMSLVKLFPPSLLQNLEELIVENCDNLEQVFDLEGLNVDDGHVGLLPKLESLNLNGLPKLRHICNWGSSTNDHFPSAPLGNIIFLKLTSMSLYSLPALTSFSPGYHSLQRLQDADLDTPLPVLFAETVAFPHLENLYIYGVDNVKRIWDDQLPQDSFSKLKFVGVESCRGLLNIFPSCVLKRSQSLHCLSVKDCISLKEIIAKDINGVLLEIAPTFVFPKLTILSLNGLPELRSLYIGAHTSQWPLLEILQVLRCDKLNLFAFETPTFEQRHHEGNLHLALFFIHHVTFPYLKKLLLGHNNDTEIWQEQFSTNSFPRLTGLDVHGYGNISVVIPSFMLQALHNLEELIVGDSSSVKEVFQLEGLEEEHQVKPLRRLRILKLSDLPGLTHLWKENNKPSPDLQSLESLGVWHCDSLINLVPSSVASFQNLATLDVTFCGSLRSLISPSIAKTLVKLKKLAASGSYMMEEIVANEGDQEAADEITFHKLLLMDLVDLPNLTSFSSSGYKFSFPSLVRMKVKGCPKMEIFSPSLLTTPKLKRVELEGHEWHCQDDLNTTIQSLFRKAHGMY